MATPEIFRKFKAMHAPDCEPDTQERVNDDVCEISDACTYFDARTIGGAKAVGE